jgi:hypothetical protein
MWIPLLLFALLFIGGALPLVLPVRWRVYGVATAVSTPILCLLLWLLARGQLSLTITHTAAPLPGLIWQIDTISWPITLWLLLLLIPATTQHLHTHTHTSTPAHLLTAFTLPIIWAGSPTTMMVSWMGLLLVWGTAVWFIEDGPEAQDRFIRHFGQLLTAVLLLWFGAAAVHTTTWNVSRWPPNALLPILLAALLPLGVWPLAGWRASNRAPADSALAVSLWPVAAGGLLLVRLANETEVGFLAGGLLLTLAGLFGLLRGVRQLWERLDLPGTAVTFLVAALVHLLLLTAVWGNEVAASSSGVLAMLRVLLLAGGICFLAARRPATRQTWWRAIPPLVALAAIAGLPLTAGLTGQVALIEGVVGHGRYLVLLVILLLQIPLLTAGLYLFLPENLTQTGAEQSQSRGKGVEETPGEKSGKEVIWSAVGLAAEAAIFLPMFGLVSVSGVVWGAVPWFTWLLLLVVPIGSVILLRFVPEFQHTVTAVRQAFTFRLPIHTAPLRQWLHGMGGAFAEAAAILEGDGSLAWLLILIMVVLLSQ